MINPPPVALIIGASREADLLRGMLRDHRWPSVGVSESGNAHAVIVASHPFDSEPAKHGLDIARARFRLSSCFAPAG